MNDVPDAKLKIKEENEPKCTLKSLFDSTTGGVSTNVVKGDEEYVKCVIDQPLSFQNFIRISEFVKYIGVTDNFKEIVEYFKGPQGHTPAGFRINYIIVDRNVLKVDLVRDISFDQDGIKHATNTLFSADSANPYEIAPIKDMIANLTCNPGIIYDLFINNPNANINNRFKTRDEVMNEIGKILGPGVDISVELNNPFNDKEEEILEEAAKFKEMLSKYRVVIKVPHTGPVNSQNVNELLTGDKKFKRRYNEGATQDMLRGHNLALMLHKHGYRINFTLMFEPYQTSMALQAKPYFINSFIRHRSYQSYYIKSLLSAYEVCKDEIFLKQLRTFMVDKDYFSVNDSNIDLLKVKEKAELILEYRKIDTIEGMDGLDAVRHNLRVLRQSNLPDTRLIICSMEGDRNYPDIDKMLTEPEFVDMADKVVITAEPAYLAQFTTCNNVISYQRRFMNAAQGQK